MREKTTCSNLNDRYSEVVLTDMNDLTLEILRTLQGDCMYRKGKGKSSLVHFFMSSHKKNPKRFCDGILSRRMGIHGAGLRYLGFVTGEGL